MRLSNYSDVKPPSEKKLIELQNRWLETRDPEVFKEFFSFFFLYARSITLKINKGNLYLDPDYINDIALDSVLKVIDRYYEDPTFRVNVSFAGWVKYPILERLYGSKQKKIDSTLSLNQIIKSYMNMKDKSDSSKKELLDLPGLVGFDHLGEDSDPKDSVELFRLQLTQVINSLFKELFQVLDLRLYLLFGLGLLLISRRPKAKFAISKFLSSFFSPQESQLFDIFVLEFRNRLLLKD